jgi:hypothetical protein
MHRFRSPLLAMGLVVLILGACSSPGEVDRIFPPSPSTGFQPQPPEEGPSDLDRRTAEAREQHRRDVVERGLGLKRPVSPPLELPATSQRFCSAAELTADIREVDEDARTAFDQEVEASNYRRAVAMRSAALISTGYVGEPRRAACVGDRTRLGDWERSVG